jgi:hypothetical protein
MSLTTVGVIVGDAELIKRLLFLADVSTELWSSVGGAVSGFAEFPGVGESVEAIRPAIRVAPRMTSVPFIAQLLTASSGRESN